MADIRMDGNTEVWWVTTIADAAEPTAAELAAGVRLSGYITDLELAPDQAAIDTTALNSTAETQAWGLISVPTTLTMKRKTVDTAWTTFEDEPDGFLVVRTGIPYATAPAAAQEVDVYPVVASVRQKVKRAKNELDKFTVKLGLSNNPVFDAEVAAA